MSPSSFSNLTISGSCSIAYGVLFVTEYSSSVDYVVSGETRRITLSILTLSGVAVIKEATKIIRPAKSFKIALMPLGLYIRCPPFSE